MNQTIFISGTPTVGKTTISEKLASEIDAKLIKINDFVFSNDLTLGNDSKKGYAIIDIDKLDEMLQNEFDGLVIVEGHVSHLCSNPNKVIILRANPNILKERLEKRGYLYSKINENLEAEAINVCGCEAYEIHGSKVQEVDVSNLEIDEIITILKDIINDKTEYPFGQIDYMDWLLNNKLDN